MLNLVSETVYQAALSRRHPPLTMNLVLQDVVILGCQHVEVRNCIKCAFQETISASFCLGLSGVFAEGMHVQCLI